MRKLKTLEMNRLTVDEFKEAPKLPLIVVLDDVRSLYNVGAVFRSGDAFRIEAVYLCGITACPPNAEIHKTALGGEDSVSWRYFERTEDAVAELKAQGYFVYSIEQVEGSTKLQHLSEAIAASNATATPHSSPLTPHSRLLTPNSSLLTPNSSLLTPHSHRYAVIFGNEVKGVKQQVVDMSDGCLEIPQFGTKHSLNVSTTAGIVMWEFCKALAL
jgi:23S rRNA (guanosine2251-2'-O)-methyltransferase